MKPALLSPTGIAFTALCALQSTLAGQPAPFPTTDWSRSTPAAQSLNPAALDSLHRRISAGEFGLIDRLFITRNGFVVADHRYANNYTEVARGKRSPIGCGPGACNSWTGPAEFNYFDPGTHPFFRGRDIHSLQSVTKSIASTMIGVAITRREIPSVDAPLLSFFTDYDLTRVDTRLRRATLADLLTMRSGIEWHENDRPLDSTNTTVQLEISSNWVQFTLDQPMDSDPGTKWVYNSGGSHLMSAIIKKASGHTIDKYAEQHLFGPLGIRDYYWKRDPQGLPDSEGGLYLEAADLAKIGYLFLKGGMWNGQRIIAESWTQTATSRIVNSINGSPNGYGYQWWRLDRPGVDIWAGQGFGGQFLIVIPSLNIVAVSNAWNVFGDRRTPLLPALLTTLISAAR